MKILIVDDEDLAINNAKKSLEKLSVLQMEVVEIQTASNVAEAKRILCERDFDLLFCDIEMPNESGLELIRWIYERSMEIKCVMLTCYADFSFIKTAMNYGVLGYILKPVELQELYKMVSKAMVQGNQERTLRVQQLLKKQDDIKQDDIKLSCLANRYFLLMIRVEYRPVEYLDWGDVSLIFVMKNVVKEIFKISYDDIIIDRDKNQYLIWLWENGKRSVDDIRNGADRLICFLREKFHWSLCVLITECKTGNDCISISKELENAVQQYVMRGNCIFYPDGIREKNFQFYGHRPVLTAVLEEGKYENFEQNVVKRLAGVLDGRIIATRESINSYLTDTIQILSSKLEEKHIWLWEKLGSHGKDLYSNYADSCAPEAFIEYVNHLLSILQEYEEDGIDGDYVCEEVKKYIADHINEPITREKLGNHVHLNVDYLNRFFKKKEKMSLVEYVIWKKMEVAKDLLQNTNLPVHVVGKKVGYDNYSYFATSFKKYAKVSPKEYRERSEM